ncbi:hypothetical protein OROMI_012797 [Orobanche minor]
MALPLGKLTLLVGAGIVGTVLAKECRVSNVSDFLSGAFKIVFKQLRKDDSAASSPKPRNDSLVQEVNTLRQMLQSLARERSVTIVTGDRSASGKYGMVVIVVVVGYGYVWWKGWRLSDMMFATRRGLNDACASVAKQLENVYSSISGARLALCLAPQAMGARIALTTRKHLSSRIDRVDCKIDECTDNTVATREEVSELRGDVKLIGSDVQSVHHVVRSLETKICRIEGRQVILTNEMTSGVGKLVNFVKNFENSRSTDQIEGAASSSGMPALELPEVSPSRAVSLPISALLEQPSPSSSNANGSRNKQPVFPPSNFSHSKGYASGLKELHGISEDVGISSPSSPQDPNTSEEPKADSSSAGVLGRTFSGISASLLTRGRSAMQSFK